MAFLGDFSPKTSVDPELDYIVKIIGAAFARRLSCSGMIASYMNYPFVYPVKVSGKPLRKVPD